MLLTGKVVLISGAGRNNGKAISLKFAEEGADLVLVAREREAELNAVVQQCEERGAKVLPILADATDPADVARLTQAALDRFGRIDAAINVIGLRQHAPALEISFADWQQAFAVNVHAFFLLAQAVAPQMVERGSGSLVALGGMAAMRPQIYGSSVVASKHALYGLVKSLALELSPHGVRVNLLNPGHIENIRANPEWYAKEGGTPLTNLDEVPLRRMGKNAEVANVAAFLASDMSSYVTGDRIMCVGGRWM
jgi:3-oxoacyl-[acyl-carrier protein] reductase